MKLWKRLLIPGTIAVVLIGLLVAEIIGYYLYSIGSPHDPKSKGYKAVEEITEEESGFVMRRYRIKAHWLARFLSGNPHQRSDDGYDAVVVISDLSGEMLARMSHWDGNLNVTVKPEGVTSPNGIDWKASR